MRELNSSRADALLAAKKHAEADATIAQLLDRSDLTPQERAAVLLKDVFDLSLEGESWLGDVHGRVEISRRTGHKTSSWTRSRT